MEVRTNARHVALPMAFLGWMSHVRVDRLAQKSAQTQSSLFFGKLDELYVDPFAQWYHEITPILAYLATFGRKWINT